MPKLFMGKLSKQQIAELTAEVFSNPELNAFGRDIFAKGETDENKVKANKFYELVKQALPEPYTGDTRIAGKVILEYTGLLINERNSQAQN